MRRRVNASTGRRVDAATRRGVNGSTRPRRTRKSEHEAILKSIEKEIGLLGTAGRPAGSTLPLSGPAFMVLP